MKKGKRRKSSESVKKIVLQSIYMQCRETKQQDNMKYNNTKRSMTYAEVTKPSVQDKINDKNKKGEKITPNSLTDSHKTYAQITSSKESNTENNDNTKHKQTEFEKVYSEDEIFTKAIAITKIHNIKLKPGRKDRGYGNCVFEAVINNINDRECFLEKLKQSPNWYRRIWMNQMLERIILEICPWNPGYTEKQLREGF